MSRARAPAAAVIGAGIAGLAAARGLGAAGFRVRVFERARGVGGRAATRRRDGGPFDHGAQYFTARDPAFRRAVDGWLDQRVVAEWKGRFVHLDAHGGHAPVGGGARYVGVPGMRDLARHLAAGLDVETGCTVDAVSRDPSGWRLERDAAAPLAGFDALVLALAPEQALRLLPAGCDLHRRAAGCPSLACWATLAAFEAPLDLPFDGAFVDDDCLAWIARDSSKPGRPPGERWVLHATPGWSAAWVDSDAATVAGAMLRALRDRVDTPSVTTASAHRWRFARVAEGAGDDCLADAASGLAVCGDWCPGSRIEGAWLSGTAAAQRLAQAMR